MAACRRPSSRTSCRASTTGKYDVLLSTTIIESGLDIPTANTLIVHRADMFGLAQLYQLRGRVGRSKQRAYALLTVAGEPHAHRDGRAAAQGAAVARYAGRRVHAGKPRSRHPRCRQPAGRGAVGTHQGSRLRALPEDAGGGGVEPQGRRRSARRRGDVVAADQYRHVRAHPGKLCSRPQRSARPLSPASPTSPTQEDIEASRPSFTTASARCRRRSSTCSQVVSIKLLCRRANVQLRCRAEGRGDRVPERELPRSGDPGEMDPGAGLARPAPAGDETGRHAQLGELRRRGCAAPAISWASSSGLPEPRPGSRKRQRRLARGRWRPRCSAGPALRRPRSGCRSRKSEHR